jgi:hypothetical protein
LLYQQQGWHSEAPPALPLQLVLLLLPCLLCQAAQHLPKPAAQLVQHLLALLPAQWA